MLVSSIANTAPSAELWSYWNNSNIESTKKINFNPWQSFLNKYLVENDNQTYLQYDNVTSNDKIALSNTISNYSKINILDYNHDEQFAYWINMYNMLTVQTILKKYPVESITDIDKNWFGQSKVWDTNVVNINGKNLTLNDIEHRILRPIWNDPRVHSAVNCASMSCPNLLKTVYQANTINTQLNTAFSDFVNSPKGVKLKDSNIYISKIFDWYGSDFGSETQMREFIAKHLNNKKIRQALLNKKHTINFSNYNWNLNQLKG
jgi:hypothetical protein